MSKNQLQNSDTAKYFQPQTTDEIIAQMKEEDAAAEREKLLRKMTPACRKKLKYFEGWLRDEVTHTLRSRYELGLQVQELYEDERKNGGKLYGKNAIGRICTILSWDEGLIRMAHRFVRAFTPEDLERLCALVLPKGEPLTWSHVRTLLHVEDARRREELLAKTAAEGWTCTELACRVKNLAEGTAGDGRGRPPQVPKDFDGAVAQQQEAAEKWDRRYTKVWAQQDRSLAARAAQLPAEEVTLERLHQARELAAQLRRVADQALEQAEKAEEVVREFERILGQRQRKAAATSEERAKTASAVPCG